MIAYISACRGLRPLPLYPKPYGSCVSKPYGSCVSKPYGSWVAKPLDNRVAKPLDNILSTCLKKGRYKNG